MATYKALGVLGLHGNWKEEEAKARSTGRVFVIREPGRGGLRSGRDHPSKGRKFACILVHPRFWSTEDTAKKNCDHGCEVVRVNNNYSTTSV